MKLAVIRRRFSATGGAELYAERLLRALLAAGHEVHLLAETWTGTASGLHFHGLTVPGHRSVRPVRFAEAVDEELRRHRFDCVLSLERTRRQDVYRAGDGVHQAWLERRRQFAAWWRKPFVGWGAFHRHVLQLERQTLDPACTRHIIVNSDMVRREIIEHFGFPEARLHHVRNGVELPRFRKGDRAATRARLGLQERDYLVLFVGSGWERKGLRFLLAAMGRLSDDTVKLLVLGKDRAPMRRPANIIFGGTSSQLEDAYAAADLFAILPIYDPCANVCLEALAAGLPVITSRQNGAAELIQDSLNGTVLADPRDTRAVTEAIGFWRTRTGRRPVPVKTDLSLERNVAETVAVLELAASERGA